MIYKILLADDEGVSLEALRVIISSEFPETTDIRLAPDAIQLKDIFSKFKPDILILNVNMANIHGITTIQEIHNAYRKCSIIILSYSHKTNFGREGQLLGIVDYIRKPVKKDTFVPILKKTTFDINLKLHSEQQQKEQKEQLEKATRFLENGMISEILFPEPGNSTIFHYMKLLDLKTSYGWILDLKYGQITEHGTMCNPIGSVVQLGDNLIRFRTIVKAFFPQAIIGPILANRVVIYHPCPSTYFTEVEERYRKTRTENMCFQLHRKLGLRFKYGYGSPQDIRNIQISLNEAKRIVNS